MARPASVNIGGSANTSKPRRKRRSRLGRFLLVSFLLIVVLIIGLVALAPTIASSMAPGIIENAVNPRLNGSLDVTDVHVRWTQAGSPVQTATAAVYDDRQNKIAQVTLESQVGILSVIGGLGNLGEFVVTGNADIIRHADGTTNLERVFAPMLQATAPTTPSQPSPQPGNLPPNLRAVFRIASLTGTYTDESLAQPLRVELAKMTGRAVFATGLPAELTLDAEVLTGSPPATPGASPTPTTPRQRGTLSIDGTVDHITNAAGALTIDQAQADITITARDLPLAIADSLAGLGGTLTRAIGDRLGFDITVAGTMKQGTANLSIATDGGTSVTGRLAFADNILTTAQPIIFTLDTARAAAADPAIQAALTSSDAARITTLPTLSVSLADLSVRVPASGAPLDLRGTSATLTAALGQMAGTVLVPGQTTPRTFNLSPMDVVVQAADLAQGVTIATAGQARIDNQPAGNLSLNARASNLLDSTGQPSKGLPTIAGQALVQDFALPIFQPILDAIAPGSGITLASAIGPTLNFSLAAESETSGGAPLAPGQIPPTTVTLAMDSANITAGGNVRLASDAIRTLDEDGVWLRIASLSPVIGPMLQSSGVTLASGGELTLRAQDIHVAEPTAATPPLDRSRARLSVAFSETRGQLTMGPAPTNYRLDPGQVTFTVDGASDSIALAGRIDALITGNARITTQLDTTLAGLLGQLTGKSQPATSSGQGITITATELGRWLTAVLPATAPVRVEPGGQMTIALTGLAVAAPPARPAGAAKASPVPDIVQRLTANFDVSGGGVRFSPILAAALPGEAAPTPEMIEMGELTLAARLAPATPPSLTLASAYTTSGQVFTIGGNLALARPLAQAATMREMVPRGRIALEQVPIELLRLLPITIVGADAQPVNLTAIAGEALGRKLDLILGLTAPPRGSPADNTGVAFRLTGRPGLRLESAGTINAEGYAANESTLTATLTPRLVEMLTNNFASTMPHKPTLTQNANLRATVAAFTIPLDENLSPRPGSTVPLRATLETAFTVDNLVLAVDANNQPINAGPVSLEGLRATASMPLVLAATPATTSPTSSTPAAPASTAPASTAPMSIDFALTARRPGRAESMLANLTGNATMSGPVLNATAALADLDLVWIESALGKPAMISGALGPILKADATFAGDPAATAQATLTLAAANLTMPQPFRVSMTPTAITLATPINATFNASPQWATRYLFGQTDPATMTVRVQRAIPFNINVPALTITRGPGRGPLVPGEWGIDATITTPEVAVVLKDGQSLTYLNPEIIVRTARNNPRQINASVRMTQAMQTAAATSTGTNAATPAAPTTPATPTSDPSQNIMRISIANLMDDAGMLNLPGATAEAIGRVPGFPTELLDAIAKQNGLLAELLGPAVTIDVTARNVPLAFLEGPTVATTGTTGAAPTAANPAPASQPPAPNLRGRVEAQITSERARARLAGDINNMVLTTSEPLSIDLNEITKAVSEHFAQGMPLISTFEKPRSLQPATVRGSAITLPMDGNLANLNGQFAIDPGELQFTSSGILGSLLKFGGGQAAGVAGRRLEPFNFTITRGVINYERFSLPVGEFTISTSGSVDLNAKSMDLLVYIPAGAVADDALGMFNIGLGQSLSQIAPGFDGSLPFRVRGPFGEAKPQPALDVFVKEFGSQLINPGNLLERFLRPGEGNGNGLPRLPFFRRRAETPPS